MSPTMASANPHPAARPAKAGMMPMFSTWLYRCEDDPRELGMRLAALARRLMAEDPLGARRTNSGGWHYAHDLFERPEPVVAEFRNLAEQHVQAFINHFRPAERRKADRFRLGGWVNVNRAGDTNLLHCHPGAFLSGVFYAVIPGGMRRGEIVFRDPRGPAVAMYETPGIDLPWVGNGIGQPFSPAAGEWLLFPSWLEHRVEPFEGEGERISVAFNASGA